MKRMSFVVGLAAVAASATLPAATVSVSSFKGTVYGPGEAALAFTGVNAAQELWVAWDDADKGADVRVETPDDAYPLFREAMPIAGEREGFFVLSIDAERRPIGKPVLVSLGHVHGTAAVELGEVFRAAFKVNADAIIVAHNHPSGDSTPSKADMQLTATLQSAARLLGLKFLDHLILGSPDCEGGKRYVSMMY